MSEVPLYAGAQHIAGPSPHTRASAEAIGDNDEFRGKDTGIRREGC